MPIPSSPPFLSNVLGYAADVSVIPDTTPSGSGVFSYQSAFPQITAIPLTAGGVAPMREDFNAVFKLLSQHVHFLQSGSLYTWNSALDYLKGSHILGSNGVEYVAQQASGPNVPGVGAKNPTTDTGVYWKASVAGGGRIPGEVVPFYNVNLGGPANRNPIFWGQSEPDTGWLICDGGSDGRGGSVPDLREKFIMGADGVDDAGQTGGADSATPTISVQSATQGGKIGDTDATGTVGVSKTGISTQGTTLNESTLPSHSHAPSSGQAFVLTDSSASVTWSGGGSTKQNLNGQISATGNSQAHAHGVNDSGHTHTFSGTDHTHTFTGTAHNHKATANAINIIPPYYKMVFCVKLPE